jgi:hypothetical protein
MGIRIKPSRNLTANRRIAIKKSGHAQWQIEQRIRRATSLSRGILIIV